jgi:uncharacterized protein (DUF58 family)
MSDPTSQPSNLPSSQPSNLPTTSPLFPPAFLRRLEALTLIARQAQRGQWQGERRSPKRGQSVEFADYRNYVPGDDFRLVDWNAYARLERFFLKLFVEEEDLTVHLLLDTSRSMDWPPDSDGQSVHKLTYARRAAAALGYIALARLDRVTASTLGNGAFFSPHRGRHQAFALFDFLSNIQPGGGADLQQALTRYAARARQPGPLLIFSDLFDVAATHPLSWTDGLTALLARRFEVSLVHLLAPDEVEPSLEGDLRLLDSETDRPVEITADYEALARYRAGLATWQNEIRGWCTQRNVTYLPVNTAMPFEAFIFAFLRQRGILK